ncbi:hypothetical protein DFH94DRAFT_71123 [Russula ochroleuca]|uniref:Uncharacterized protein n=1 Tax=Russula ochroleuca TaxID=152965 RepID=A0A9P5JT32_9AGAM|nr:hypothetical protein DFH94DRAFT_71123 [Russula ochroleuca]
MRELLPNDRQCMNAVGAPSSPTQEHIPASPPTLPDRPLFDHIHEVSTDDRQCVNATSTSASPTQEHVPMSQSSALHIRTPPDKLHPTLSTWIKNMNKLSSLIDRLEELSSFGPTEHRSQLSNQVMALRATSKKQQDHFMEFLQLSEEYANRYLLDISAEIKQQSSFLEKLEGRLECAKKLREDAIELQMLYESGTVATMQDLRATALSRPLPEDHALFSEVDSVLTEIRRCYMEMDKFWTEEISRAIEALKMRRVDPTDFERWKNFHANLKQTTESWKNEPPSGDAQILRRNNASSSKEADIGAIASSFSSAMGLLTSALDRLHSSGSLKYSQLGPSSIQRIYVTFAANKDVCLTLLQRCADYGVKLIGLPSVALPTSLRVMTSQDLWERTMRLRFEMTEVSMEKAASVQGLSSYHVTPFDGHHRHKCSLGSGKFNASYNKALSLEQKVTSGLNTLLEKLSSWPMVTNSLPDDVLLPDVITLEKHRELWEKARYTVSVALAVLKNEPAPQSFYHSALLASTRPRSLMKRWMVNLVRFS